MKKMLTDIDGALTAQRATDARARPDKNVDPIFGLYRKQNGQLSMGNKAVGLNVNGKTLTIDIEYKITPDLEALIVLKHPRPTQFNSSDYKAYKSLVAQTKVKSFPNREGNAARPHTTWKWKHMLKKMVIPGERIVEVESEDTDDTRHCFNMRYW